MRGNLKTAKSCSFVILPPLLLRSLLLSSLFAHLLRQPPSSNSPRSPFCLHFLFPNAFNKVERSWQFSLTGWRCFCARPRVDTQTHIKHTPPRAHTNTRLPMVQCSPFQPWWHWHFPSLQVPCLMQSGLHTRWSQPAPVQPSSQRQAPPIHTPWVPQSTEHTSEGSEKDLGHKHYFWTHKLMFFVGLYFAICQMWHNSEINTDLVTCRPKDVWMSFLDVCCFNSTRMSIFQSEAGPSLKCHWNNGDM